MQFFHTSPVAMTLTTLDDSTYLDVNDAYARLVGRPREQLVGRSTAPFRLTDATTGRPIIAERAASNPVFTARCLLPTAKDATRRVLASVQVEEWKGQPFLFTSVEDLTDLERIRETLLDTEQRYQVFFDSIPLPVFVYDLETFSILDVNSAAEEVYGYTHDELLQMTALDVRPPDQRLAFQQFVSGLSPDPRTYGIWKHQRKDGSIFDVYVSGYGFDVDGRHTRVAVCQDVTEQQALHEALRLNEERNRIIAEVTNDVLWESDEGGNLHFSEGVGTVFGHKPTNPTPMLWWAEKIHPNEREEIYQSYRQAVENGQSFWSTRYRFRRHDGSYIHVLDRAYIFRNEAGRPTRIVGSMIDITNQVELKEAAALAARDERLRLARDLHDALTQSLYSLSLLAEAARRQANLGNHETANEYVGRLGELAQQSLKEMRLLVYELQPSVLEKEGLIAALKARLDAVERHSGINAELKIDIEQKLSPELQLQYYRVAEEALNNALKHADATSAKVWIQSGADGTVLLEIRDNGIGFDPNLQNESAGLGLTSMRERMEKLGGELELISAPGEGTTIRVKVNHANFKSE